MSFVASTVRVGAKPSVEWRMRLIMDGMALDYPLPGPRHKPTIRGWPARQSTARHGICIGNKQIKTTHASWHAPCLHLPHPPEATSRTSRVTVTRERGTMPAAEGGLQSQPDGYIRELCSTGVHRGEVGEREGEKGNKKDVDSERGFSEVSCRWTNPPTLASYSSYPAEPSSANPKVKNKEKGRLRRGEP